MFGKIAKCFLAVLGLQLLCSCASSFITPNFSRSGFSLSELRAARSVLIVSDKAQVLGFKKSYAKAYGKDEPLSKQLSRILLDSLNASGTGMSITKGPSRLAAALDQAASDTVVKPDSLLFKSIDARFVVHVGNIVISSSKTYTAGVLAPSGPGGQMTMTGGGTSNNCNVSFDVTIWNVDDKMRVISFSVTGNSSVFLFFYQTALENAVWKTAWHAVEHLRNAQPKS